MVQVAVFQQINKYTDLTKAMHEEFEFHISMPSVKFASCLYFDWLVEMCNMTTLTEQLFLGPNLQITNSAEFSTCNYLLEEMKLVDL